jgi:hypothetical protein
VDAVRGVLNGTIDGVKVTTPPAKKTSPKKPAK